MAIDVTNRRNFLVGFFATGLMPKPTWADAGSPAYLSAAGHDNGSFTLCGIDIDQSIVFQIPLPGRGHAAAAHPDRPEAVAFARRPGTFAIVIDCISGTPKAQLSAPEGRHFYGHGAFSKDGRWLFTTENDFEAGQGRIGVWDVASGYARTDEFSSGGVGPHDIKRLPGSDVLVIANGGIGTHPDSGRTKLNIPTMAPNLSYAEGGAIVETAHLPSRMHKNSIRHLAISPAGQVAFGMQWQGGDDAPSLVGLHVRGGSMQLCDTSQDQVRAMQGYIGSIAFAQDGALVAVTSPRGNRVQLFDATQAEHLKTLRMQDACGIAADRAGFIVTGGTGDVYDLRQNILRPSAVSSLHWDNHLVPV